MTPEAKEAMEEAYEIHTVLDAVGYIPIAGEPADFINGIIYASEKDYLNAGIALAAVVPVVGEAAKAGKLGAKAIEVVDKVDDVAEVAANGAKDGVDSTIDIAKHSGNGGACKGGLKTDLDGITIINKKCAGQTYELSGDFASKYPDGVKFTNEGFPDFSPYSNKTVKVDGLQGDAYYDFIKANQAAGFKSTPKGYTWHHVEDGTTLMLVPSDLHGTVRHTGGASLIREGIRP